MKSTTVVIATARKTVPTIARPRPDREGRCDAGFEWTQKQEREYAHIVESERDSGASARRAKQIAARTINKERARSGQSETASRSSLDDVSSSHRGGVRAHPSGPRGRTEAQLMNEARKRNIPGRSSMSKSELEHAVDARTRS